MNELIIESRREQKSRETKEKIKDAMKMLISKYDYEHTTINNICVVAEGSKGTFYHYFKNKDELLNYYTVDEYDKYKKKNRDRLSKMNSLERIFDIYKWYVGCLAESGVQFVSDYFSLHNQVLKNRRTAPAMEAQKVVEESPDSLAAISISTFAFVKKAQKEGLLTKEITALELFYELEIVMFGVVFEWCLSNGLFNISDRVEEILNKYLKTYIIK